MWTFNDFPTELVAQKYHFTATPEWLAHARASSVRLARGCSGSIVSPNGLVLTNHHCAHGCIEALSSGKKDLIKDGFVAKTASEERKCPNVEVNQLLEISDVTQRINAATEKLSGAEFFEAIKGEMSQIEKECATSESIRCDVVTLFGGGRYDLYRYRRFQDIRLVFAPEFATAFFGGDPDNFMFPRYDFDVSFLRIYENGEPAHTNDYFRWSVAGAAEGELAFISGNPGKTDRLSTIAELKYQRDIALPEELLKQARWRGLLGEFQMLGREQERISTARLFFVENSFKGNEGRREALIDEAFFAQKVAEEQKLRGKIDADPQKKALYGTAWDEVAAATERLKRMRKPLAYLERGQAFSSRLFEIARRLVRAADELPKPNRQRLREYAESSLPVMQQALFSPAPIYRQMEVTSLAHSLSEMREQLTPDHPAVKAILGKKSPRELAEALVKGTKLDDLEQRRLLYRGGKSAVAASRDPMIRFALQVDPAAREVRKRYEEQVESVIRKNGEQIARARFAIYGSKTYPDATFSPRLSFGRVRGWAEEGSPVQPISTFAGAFERDTGQPPFALPRSWLAARSRLDLSIPLNFCTDHEVVGGNSGSPMINRNLEIVGLIFDGNIHSLGSTFGFPPNARAVAVHSRGIIEGLEKIYGATRIVQELRPISRTSLK
jgi:hypothetical protein